MDNRSEVREFLTSRRASLTPEQAGFPAGSNRRVPGLRRGEVAVLADVSVEYYSKIERGNLVGASEAVLEAISRALQLDAAERSHLFDLARAATGPALGKPRRTPKLGPPRASLQLVLDAITGGPAFVRNGRMDIIATNPLGHLFYDEALNGPGKGNIARYAFLDDRAESFYPDWSRAADITVAILRTEAGRDPYDKGLQDLVGELSTRSDEFRTRWGAHNVRQHTAGEKGFHHHAVGELTLTYEQMSLNADPGLSLLIYTAEPGSATHERLQLLASLATTPSKQPTPSATEVS
ncbi:helix-turn-helix transcriptional regulator [Microbacterium sp. GXF0217]